MNPRIEAAISTDEMIVDLFAGAGGASEGIEAAAGRPADIAINHDAAAIRMHQTNHPDTKHFISDIWEVDPREATGGRPVGLLWMSPDCKHFSRAKGQTPVQASVRALADVLHTWIEKAPPRIIILENVQEFEGWGPLLETEKGLRPDPDRVGETFRAWLAKIVNAGYSVDFKPMNAADYGAATTRVRLFLIARRDRDAVIFPEATHDKKAADGLEPWIPVANVINWEHPTKSIFNRTRPLAEATMNRIAMGLERYVTNGDPYIVRHGHYSKRTGAGIRPGAGAGLFRGQGLDAPIGTICATNDKNLVVPWLVKHYGGMVGNPMSDTLGTITTRDSQSVADALLAPVDATDRGHDVAAFLVKYFGTAVGQSMRSPLGTLTTKDRYALIQVHGQPYRIIDVRMRMLQPDELYKAQGFRADYIHTHDYDGRKFTKTEQIRFVGNSVCPAAAEALVGAQVAA